jgi:hypothetical protein
VPAGAQFTVLTDSPLVSAWGGRSWGGSHCGYPKVVLTLRQALLRPTQLSPLASSSFNRQFFRSRRRLVLSFSCASSASRPTVVHTDAKVLVDAALSKRVSQEAICVAPRYAMIRRAKVDGAVEFVQTPSAENRVTSSQCLSSGKNSFFTNIPSSSSRCQRRWEMASSPESECVIAHFLARHFPCFFCARAHALLSFFIHRHRS